MNIVNENNIRWLTVSNENNSLYDINQNVLAGKRLIPAKSITEANVNQFFKEITAEEAEKINQETKNNI